MSDKIVAAASFYFESPSTREIAARMRPIFQDGDAVFFVDESVEGFAAHGLLKKEKSPRGLIAYRDRDIILAKAHELDNYRFILKRPDISISDGIVRLWVADLQSKQISSLGYSLQKCILDAAQRRRTEEALISFALSRQKDFVWQYLLPLLKRLGLPRSFKTLCRRKLSQMYCLATSEAIGALPDRSVHAFASGTLPSPRFDTDLFLVCMRYLRLEGSLRRLRTPDLMTLKTSDTFGDFKAFYFLLADAAAYQAETLVEGIKHCRRAESVYPESGSVYDRFLASFTSLFATLPTPCMKTTRPLEYLLRMYDVCNVRVVKDFVTLTQTLSSSRGQSRLASPEHVMPAASGVISSDVHTEIGLSGLERTRAMARPTDLVFISYSHRDREWLDRLQVHLKPQERTGAIEAWDDTRCQPGTKWKEEIANALAAAKVAILLVSADFLASDFIANNELPPILEAAKSEGLTILSVIVSPCRFAQTPMLPEFQAVNAPSRPLTAMSKAEQEQVFVDVTIAIDGIRSP
ncbi:MAG: TIR domain-containing protein [Nitrospiraceae bacterium]|nr:TIR domain-containing protein [Nitrospiraceae bacterium]